MRRILIVALIQDQDDHLFMDFEYDGEKIDLFDCDVKDAIEDFKNAEPTKWADIMVDTGGEFNWGDTNRYLPEEYLNKRGIRRVDHDLDRVLVVEHDEQLIDNDEEKQEA